MAKKGSGTVYRVTEVIGTSSNSWEDAARNAVKTAAEHAARPAHRRDQEARRQDRGRQDRAVPRAPGAVLQVRRLRRRVHRGRAHHRRRAPRGFPRAPALADGARRGRRGLHRAPRRGHARVPLPAADAAFRSRRSPRRRRDFPELRVEAEWERDGDARPRGDRERPADRADTATRRRRRWSTSRSARRAASSSA